MDETQTILRMALAMQAADVTSTLSQRERAWIVQRLQVVDGTGHHLPLDTQEVTMLLPSLLTWGDTRSEAFGRMVRDLLTGGETPTYVRRGTQLTLVECPTADAPHPQHLATPLTMESQTYGSTERKG